MTNVHKNHTTEFKTKHVIDTMPNQSDIDRRNRSLMAFTLLTGG